MSSLLVYGLSALVVVQSGAILVMRRIIVARHEWSPWRKWSYGADPNKWILSEPQLRECMDCGLKQRVRWWRR